MGKKNPRVDEYIHKAEDFAKPILTHLRQLVHKTAPEAEEVIKWGFPHFAYKGNICFMSSFKNHCAFGFWKAEIMKDPHNILNKGGEAMGQLGRIGKMEDLPPDNVLKDYIKEAIELNDKGVKLPKKTSQKKLDIPEYFMDTVNADALAKETFNSFSYSHKKEYVEWVTEAKTEATRNKRLKQAVEWMREGKGRNWKYMRKQ